MNTKAEETESGNGKALQNLFIKHEMISMNTWRRNPGQTEHDPDSAITWISQNGKNNAANRLHSYQPQTSGLCPQSTYHTLLARKIEQNRQRSAVIMKIQLRYKRNYFTKPSKGTGTEIRRNITQARKQPELLEQHFLNKQIHIQYEHNKTTTENWNHAIRIVHDALQHVYPEIKTNNNKQIWNLKGYEYATQEEKENTNS